MYIVDNQCVNAEHPAKIMVSSSLPGSGPGRERKTRQPHNEPKVRRDNYLSCRVRFIAKGLGIVIPTDRVRYWEWTVHIICNQMTLSGICRPKYTYDMLKYHYHMELYDRFLNQFQRSPSSEFQSDEHDGSSDPLIP
jgi:hypothetical protein